LTNEIFSNIPSDSLFSFRGKKKKKKKKKGGWGHLKKQNARVTNYFKIVVQFFNVPIWHGRESEGALEEAFLFQFYTYFFYNQKGSSDVTMSACNLYYFESCYCSRRGFI